METYSCRYTWICKGANAPATCQPAWLKEHDGRCVNADGEAVTLKSCNDWCRKGWDPSTPMCSGEVDNFWYLDTQAIRCPSGGRAVDWVFSIFLLLTMVILFFVINDWCRPVWKSKFYGASQGAFVLNRRVDLHAYRHTG